MLDSLLNLSIQVAEVLLRKIPRICPYFRVSQKKILQGEPVLETKTLICIQVKRSDLFHHCRNTLPRDYFMSTHRSAHRSTTHRFLHIYTFAVTIDFIIFSLDVFGLKLLILYNDVHCESPLPPPDIFWQANT